METVDGKVFTWHQPDVKLFIPSDDKSSLEVHLTDGKVETFEDPELIYIRDDKDQDTILWEK